MPRPLLGLSSIFFTWTEKSFTSVDAQMIIWGILYIAIICVFLACKIGPYCFKMEQHELD